MVFIHFFVCAVNTMRGKMTVNIMAAFAQRVLDSMLRRCTALTQVSSSFEWHHFVDRSALFTNSFRRHRDIVPA
jgi:hypothetical protein